MSDRARDEIAHRLVHNCEPALARALTGGKSDRLTSEQAARVAAEVARAGDQGREADRSTVIKETTRR